MNLTIILFLLGVLGVLAGVFFVRKRSTRTGTAQTAGASAPDTSSRPKKPDDHARMLVAVDYVFASIESGMQRLGMRPDGPSGTEVSPGEPESAVWINDGNIRVTYRFDPRVSLRALDIRGDNARFLLNDILNILYIPSLEGYKLSGFLESSDPQDLLLGVLAAEHIGIHGDERFYIEQVGQLTTHANSEVAAAATKALATMQAGVPE